MDLKRFGQLMGQAVKGKLTVSPEQRAARELAANNGAARLRRNGGLHPYDSYRQRARYGRQHAKQLAKEWPLGQMSSTRREKFQAYNEMLPLPYTEDEIGDKL